MQMNELQGSSDNEIDEPRGIPGPVKIVGLLSVVGLIVFGVIVLNNFEPEETWRAESEALWNERDPEGEDDHETLRFASEEPAVRPEMLPLSALPDNDLASRAVIGLVEGDTAHAIVVKPNGKVKNVYLATTLVGDRPVVIMHSYLKRETRVLAGPPGDEPLDIKLGGGDFLQNLVMLYDGVRYSQVSEKIPLEEYDFTITTLDKWVEQHPDTLINFDEELHEKDFHERNPSWR